MIHKAYMPVYSDPDFSCGTDGTDGPTEGSTRGPRGPKNQIRTHNANEQMGQPGAMSEGRSQRRLNFADESREVRFSLNILIHFDIEQYVKTASITVYHRWI